MLCQSPLWTISWGVCVSRGGVVCAFLYSKLYTYLTYCKIPNISHGLIEIRKHFLGGLHSGVLVFRGAYIRRAFCVSIFVSRRVKCIIISMKYRYHWQKLSFLKQNSPLLCFTLYLNLSWYLFIVWLSTYSLLNTKGCQLTPTNPRTFNISNIFCFREI